MFSPAHAGINACARVGVEAGGMGAGPHKLIGKAIRVVESGLQLALNVKAGGEVAPRPNALCSYMTQRLLEANIQESESMLVEVGGLLATLEEAWLGIAPEVERMAVQPSGPRSGPLTR